MYFLLALYYNVDSPHITLYMILKIQEIKEAVELPLTHPELYEEIGIRPPKGVVLYGEPGTLICTLFTDSVHILIPERSTISQSRTIVRGRLQ